tara:strand:- start:275 stop:511 length:237 start_codon:yes stop_codon:yes gene_type:complete
MSGKLATSGIANVNISVCQSGVRHYDGATFLSIRTMFWVASEIKPVLAHHQRFTVNPALCRVDRTDGVIAKGFVGDLH